LTMQLVPTVAEAGGWRWAFALLALGPAAGIWSIRQLQRLGRRWQTVP
jgi:dipeptide/tripeptide permease